MATGNIIHDSELAVAPNYLATINNRIHASNDMINRTIENLSEAADRVFGAIPRVAENMNTKPQPVSSGQIDDINLILDRLHDNIQRLVEEAERFNRL